MRILSATNRDLQKMVEEKLFREDLFYRLNSFPIYIPPLRERKSDILVLAEHFLNSFNKKLSKNFQGFTNRALKMMYDYPWPGNVREMENTIERCVIISEGKKIDVEDFPLHIQTIVAEGVESSEEVTFNRILPFEKIKEEAIRHALKVTEGNILEAAKRLELGRATIYRLMEKYNIAVADSGQKNNE